MIGKKSKPVATNNITLTRINSQPIKAKADDLEYLAGRDPGTPIYTSQGCALKADVVLARFYPTDQFTVHVKIGEHWYATFQVPADDPAIQELRDSGALIECEEEPGAKARREHKEAEEREKRETEEHEKRMRTEHARMLREQEEERKRKAIEGRNASIGPL